MAKLRSYTRVSSNVQKMYATVHVRAVSGLEKGTKLNQNPVYVYQIEVHPNQSRS